MHFIDLSPEKASGYKKTPFGFLDADFSRVCLPDVIFIFLPVKRLAVVQRVAVLPGSFLHGA